MTTLAIDLRDGFFRDHVVVELDGREVFRREDLRTRTQVGLADSVKVETEPGERSVRVWLPDRNISAETTVDVERTPYLGVSLESGALVLRPAAQPYRYL